MFLDWRYCRGATLELAGVACDHQAWPIKRAIGTNHKGQAHTFEVNWSLLGGILVGWLLCGDRAKGGEPALGLAPFGRSNSPPLWFVFGVHIGVRLRYMDHVVLDDTNCGECT